MQSYVGPGKTKHRYDLDRTGRQEVTHQSGVPPSLAEGTKFREHSCRLSFASVRACRRSLSVRPFCPELVVTPEVRQLDCGRRGTKVQLFSGIKKSGLRGERTVSYRMEVQIRKYVTKLIEEIGPKRPFLIFFSQIRLMVS